MLRAPNLPALKAALRTWAEEQEYDQAQIDFVLVLYERGLKTARKREAEKGNPKLGEIPERRAHERRSRRMQCEVPKQSPKPEEERLPETTSGRGYMEWLAMKEELAKLSAEAKAEREAAQRERERPPDDLPQLATP